jgi:hypothetical protein
MDSLEATQHSLQVEPPTPLAAVALVKQSGQTTSVQVRER